MALEGFLVHFATALVAMHRDQRGVGLVRTGQHDRYDIAATALRVVRLEPGCAVLDVEPIDLTGDGGLAEDAPTLAEATVERLAAAVTAGEHLPAPIVEPLEAARRQCGQNGRFTVDTFSGSHHSRAVFDAPAIQSLREPEEDEQVEEGPVTSVVGRLVRLSEAPEQVIIREPDGTEWLCHFDDAVAEDLGPLWRQTVWAEGEGERRSTGRPRFLITGIQRAILGAEQTELFSHLQVPTADVVARYGVVAPQEPEALSPDDLVDDESEDRYLEAILG